MQAIILAGGLGTRLRPYTTILPKPLMPIDEYPILEIIVKQLKSYGFSHLIFTVGHLKELIHAFFHDGSRWGVRIDYSFEEKKMGTAGPLTLIEELEDNFLVMNGDLLTTLNFKYLFDHHMGQNAICTVATFQKSVKIDLGVLETSAEGRIVNYIEKPTINYKVSSGIYCLNKRVLDFIPTDKYYDMPDLVKKLISEGETINEYPINGEWLDIGNPNDYNEAVDKFLQMKEKFLP